MSLSIDELQVETQPPLPAPPAAPVSAAAPPPKPDVKAELEKVRERYLRLQAD
jgi:hypothetical protein